MRGHRPGAGSDAHCQPRPAPALPAGFPVQWGRGGLSPGSACLYAQQQVGGRRAGRPHTLRCAELRSAAPAEACCRLGLTACSGDTRLCAAAAAPQTWGTGSLCLPCPYRGGQLLQQEGLAWRRRQHSSEHIQASPSAAGLQKAWGRLSTWRARGPGALTYSSKAQARRGPRGPAQCSSPALPLEGWLAIKGRRVPCAIAGAGQWQRQVRDAGANLPSHYPATLSQQPQPPSSSAFLPGLAPVRERPLPDLFTAPQLATC